MGVLSICVLNMYKGMKIPYEFVAIFAKIDPTIRVVVVSVTNPVVLRTLKAYDAIIISGSDRRVLVEMSGLLPKNLLSIGVPVLGICYGFQWMVYNGGGVIATFANDVEHSYNKFLTFEEPFHVDRKRYRFYHHDYIRELPLGFIKALGEGDEIWVAYDNDRRHLGVQFHPEKFAATSVAFFRRWLEWAVLSKVVL